VNLFLLVVRVGCWNTVPATAWLMHRSAGSVELMGG
jgi:hypothetical protein